MRGRRGRHCPPLRRSAQRRCLALGPGRKGLGACTDSPGSRGARLGLKRPHLLSRRRLPESLWRHNDPDARADAAPGGPSRALRHRHLTAARGEKPAYRPSAGATPTPKPKPSGPALSRYLGRGGGGARTKPTSSCSRPAPSWSFGPLDPTRARSQRAQELF